MSKKLAIVRKTLFYGFLVLITVSRFLSLWAFCMVLNSFIDNAELLQSYGSGGFEAWHFIPREGDRSGLWKFFGVPPGITLMKLLELLFMVSIIVIGADHGCEFRRFRLCQISFSTKNTLLSIIIVFGHAVSKRSCQAISCSTALASSGLICPSFCRACFLCSACSC